MDVRLSLVEKVDGGAIGVLTFLIHSYLNNHSNIGCIGICKNEIIFTKGIFFTVGRIKYAPYQLDCRNGVIYYSGTDKPNLPKDTLTTLLFNALYQLRSGQIAKI